MKAETKAKRRVTLSICSLGMLDETEVETIKDVVKIDYSKLIDQKPKEMDETIIETQKIKEQQEKEEREEKLKIWSEIKIINEFVKKDINNLFISLFNKEIKDCDLFEFKKALEEMKAIKYVREYGEEKQRQNGN